MNKFTLFQKPSKEDEAVKRSAVPSLQEAGGRYLESEGKEVVEDKGGQPIFHHQPRQKESSQVHKS